ncbi:adenylate/guanylate cyclase domain-containing protein [Aeromicrobium ginsengisoli]|uniref:Adenylate/guanylate cyclase domain-containing protein n=1 Tax=Aeromicrobium ginsengisoli TaxID=363867 RepID=A0A5M4FEE0_9ACTN|nr:adenylate/guanylate cyclase domain-containing protein [Aeromicrobium ginsengisoli]KAA1397632.1 adenylate/guanylate cyclase domain-containing protein [Aeromicrobium ginsengisoli]
MTLVAELETYVDNVFTEEWSRRQGQKVPETADIALKNSAVELDATVLYADLAGSTAMVRAKHDYVAAEIYKAYLYCAAKLIRNSGGIITAYDGDRVMGVFIGDSKNSNAAVCGLNINHAASQIVLARYKKKWPKTDFQLKQRVGVDTSKLFVARTGIRGNNDLVWVGNAANNAAKMAALDPAYPTYISASVYSRLNEVSKFSKKDQSNMWTDLGTAALGYQIYGSTWWRAA